MRLILLLAGLLCCYQAYADKCVAVEIAWVLDVSGTISVNDHNLAKSFIKKVMSEISLSPHGHKAGIAYYGDEGHTHANCSQYQSDTAFSKAVDRTPQLVGQLTNTESGITKGMEILENNGCGERDGVSQGMVLITDGEANTGGSLESLVAVAKRVQNEKHVQMFSVAVGNFNLEQLKMMMPEENIIKVEDFESLKSVSIDINRFCKITVPTTTTSTPIPEETTTTTSTPIPEETTTTTSTPIPEETTTTTTTTPVPEETTTTTSTPIPEETTTTTTTTPVPEETTTTTSTPVPEETTTTTSTPVPEETTTTTSTPIPEETTTTPSTPVNMDDPKCYCNATNVEKFTCLKWTKFEIIKTFEGTCYVDKLKKAISHIDSLKIKLAARIQQSNTCKTVLQNQIKSLKVAKKVFQAYDNCVVLSTCKLERIQKELMDKKKSLLKELKYEEEGYGSLKSIGADLIKGILAESW